MFYHITAQNNGKLHAALDKRRACSWLVPAISPRYFQHQTCTAAEQFSSFPGHKKNHQNRNAPFKFRARCERPVKTPSLESATSGWLHSLSSKVPHSFSLCSTFMLVWAITLLTVPQTSCSNAPYVQKTVRLSKLVIELGHGRTCFRRNTIDEKVYPDEQKEAKDNGLQHQ